MYILPLRNDIRGPNERVLVEKALRADRNEALFISEGCSGQIPPLYERIQSCMEPTYVTQHTASRELKV